MTELVTVVDPIPRDGKKRPLVRPVGRLNAKPIPYTRCTTYVECLEDRYNLEKWKMRAVAVGLADNPDLVLSVAAYRDDKRKLDEITWKASEAAKAGAAATTGTALHALTEKIDRGQGIGSVPQAYVADLDAYRAATSHMDMLLIERFTVQDSLKVGGTPDRVVRVGDRSYIADVKTGSIDWGAGKIAMQLSMYAHSLIYDPKTGLRSPLPDDLDDTRGIVIHLPAGQGACTLHWIDLAAGWEAVTLATRVRQWRTRKDLFTPYAPPLATAVTTAATVDELVDLWTAHEHEWTDELTELAAARKAVLTSAA